MNLDRKPFIQEHIDFLHDKKIIDKNNKLLKIRKRFVNFEDQELINELKKYFTDEEINFYKENIFKIYLRDINLDSLKCINPSCNDLKYLKGMKLYEFCENCYKTLPKEEKDNLINSICKTDRAVKNTLKKYGVRSTAQLESTKEKQRKTNLEKYGGVSPSQNKEIRQKQLNSLIEKFGVDNALKVPEIQKIVSEKNKISMNKPEVKKRIKETSLKKYGVPYYTQSYEFKKFIQEHSEEFQEKAKETSLKKYGAEYYTRSYEFKSKNSSFISKEEYQKRLKNLNPEFVKANFINKNNNFMAKDFCNYFICGETTAYKYMRDNNINYDKFAGTSQAEKEIVDFIKSIYNGNIIENTKNIITPYELDIYIPDKSLAIEYNGLAWHSYGKAILDKTQEDLSKQRYRHLKKTEACESKNINLLHIFENEWLNPRTQEIWKSVISYKLGITKEKYFARKLEIKFIEDKKLVKEFFNENHLQGGDSPAKIAVGAFDNDKLISCMTFAKSRYSKDYDYELIRFASKKFTACVGCAQRLFKHFLREYQPKSVISYANRRWASSLSNLYKSIGFRYLRTAEPNYFYFQLEDPNLRLWPRVKYQKHKLKNLNLSGYNPSKTETEIMFDSGYRRIYDSGNLVYEWRS